MTNTPQGTKIYRTHRIEEKKHSLLHTIDALCKEHLFTFAGYIQAVKHTLKINRLIPIYLDEFNQLIPIKRFRDYDNLFINYASVTHTIAFDEGIQIVFISGRKLYIKMSLYSWTNQTKKMAMIRNTKVKHFH